MNRTRAAPYAAALRSTKKLERTPITLPVNRAYKTDVKKMICTCPSLPVSRFLLCKHVVQGHEPVPPVFFLEDNEDADDLVDTRPHDDSRTFEEAMDDNIDLILEFAKGLKYQRQFRDQRMLQVLEREGASFLRLARVCVGKEKKLRSTRDTTPSTWKSDKSTNSAMVYRARLTVSDNLNAH
ncbi:hypothetical protein K438DRAFT_1906879 [Mycena galopus ATCC 62051]|nr:hypothetical protein K438DRAFT_1906879 [Mycena galopus ATCC 62051]